MRATAAPVPNANGHGKTLPVSLCRRSLDGSGSSLLHDALLAVDTRPPKSGKQYLKFSLLRPVKNSKALGFPLHAHF